MLPDNYDPKPESRTWYRSTLDGQLGYFVKRDGIAKIRLDRPHEILKPFNKQEWTACSDQRKLTPYHLGEITFEADRVLCRIYGKYSESGKTWSGMENKEKSKWISAGPSDDPARVQLYNAIKNAMGAISEKNSRTVDPE